MAKRFKLYRPGDAGGRGPAIETDDPKIADVYLLNGWIVQPSSEPLAAADVSSESEFKSGNETSGKIKRDTEVDPPSKAGSPLPASEPESAGEVPADPGSRHRRPFRRS